MAALWGSLVLVLVHAALYNRSEAVSQRDVDRVYLTYNLDSDKCKDITDSSSRDSKKTADDACQQAFFALDRIKQNTCQNWSDARCRFIPGQTYRQCSSLVTYYDDSNIIATPFRECAKNIASEVPSTRVELAQSKQKRKHDDAQTSARKRYIPMNTEPYGRVGTSIGPHSSGTSGSSEAVPIGNGASSSGSAQTSGGAASQPQYNGSRPFPCTVCTKSYKNLRNLNTHLQCHNSKETTCPVCHGVFSLRSNLKTHIDKAHPGTPLPEKAQRTAVEAGVPALFPCPHCPKSYVYERTLKEHLKSHETDETKCPVCKKVFTNIQNLRVHIENGHPGTPIPERVPRKPKELGPFFCKECGNEYVTKKILRNHEKSHETLDTHCFDCKQTFASRGGYIKHLKSSHPADALALGEAEKKRYIEENPEVCEICNNRFKNIDQLRRHGLVHKGKTQCEFCGQVFKRLTTLNTHKARAHKILKPH